MTAKSEPHIFGIRHHGPGSARSLLQALYQLEPDCLLIEGPPEADGLIPFVGQADMEPPLALLLYAKDDAKQAVFYPFARYSPEWQALQFGVAHNIPTRFFDLPVAYRFAHEMAEKERRSADKSDAEPEEQVVDQGDAQPAEDSPDTMEQDASASDPFTPEPTAQPTLREDPLLWLARAAGYTDGERWWEQLVEERLEGENVFAAILEAMTALREEVKSEEAEVEEAESEKSLSEQSEGGQSADEQGKRVSHPDIWEQRREAQMRANIRKAQKEGFKRIAVVCGAWHAPVLNVNAKVAPKVKDDNALLKGLAKCKVESTWIPWTSGRLARASGYGAGITSPGWYDHLWRYADRGSSEIATRWLARTAQLLRDEGLEAASAQVIDGVRLAETLAAMRGRSVAGLDELNEATYALFANGNELVLELISEKLIVGNVLGTVNDQVPSTPLQNDFAKVQKSLRFKVSAVERDVEFDLRKPNDLSRSHLLHRLRLLGIPWGEERQTSGKGTFKEAWHVQWHPEFELRLIEASRYGQTVEQASSNRVMETCQAAENLAELSAILNDTILAHLPEATQHLVSVIHYQAAQDSDLTHLMVALPRLAHVLRYGDVRTNTVTLNRTDTDEGQDIALLENVVQSILARIYIGLPNVCSDLADDAATTIFSHLLALHSAVKTLQREDDTEQWLDALQQLTNLTRVHPLLKGRATKILFDEERFDSTETARRFQLALSDPNVEAAAAWLEGLLQDGGLLLVHDDALFGVLDSWFETLSDEAFVRVLPLIRRTFSSFSPPERQNIGRRAKGGQQPSQNKTQTLNHERGVAVLAHVAQLLGREGPILAE